MVNQQEKKNMIAAIIGILMIIAFISLVISYYESSMLFSSISLLIWITILATVMGIENYWISSGTFTTEYKQDFGLFAICLGMIFITVIMFIQLNADFKKSNKLLKIK